MKIVIRAKNLILDKNLKKYIEEKINSLEKFLNIFQDQKSYYENFLGKGKPKVEAWVEVEKTTSHHLKGEIFRAETQIKLPGKNIRGEARSENPRTAINEVKDELQEELKKYKDKLIAKRKKYQRRLKKDISLSPRARFYRKGRILEEGI